MRSLSSISRWPVYPFIRYGLLLLGLLALSRLLLIAWQFERVGDIENALTVLLFGLRFDVIVICILWFFPALILLLLPQHNILAAIQTGFSKFWLMLSTILIVFLEISTPAFIDQYDTRPNRIFFEYLETPVEVLKTSIYEYPWHFVAATILLFLLIRYLSTFNRQIFQGLKPWPVLSRIIALPLLILLLVMGARSSFDHRPANPSTAAFSNDQLVNKLGLSSIYTVLTAAYNLRHEDSGSSAYGEMEPQKMVGIIRNNSFIGANSFDDDQTSTWHSQSVSTKPTAPNLVIILEESLGAGFVGKLGGIGVTPELDKLSDEGLWFTNLYATGTRSARGIEAVTTGFPPSPSRSVIKLGLAQQKFVTIASILKQHDYDTQFIYGGESHFDNMAGFFLANGFDKVTDQNDYTNEKFRGTWGVSDEDLFHRVDEQLVNASDKPQFILAFTSSNHSPFEFPDNTIDFHDSNKHTVNNAVKYADYALGKFFEQAKSQAYWDNTYFLVVADHDTRVFGAALVPVNKFHIPGLIIGPGVEARHYTKVASQIDLAPTLLGMMGLSNKHPMIGHDLVKLPDSYAGRAIMQYDNNHAYMLGNDVVVHVPEKAAKQFSYQNKKLYAEELDEGFAKTARAHALWPMYAYREKKYLYQ
ncbi:MAG: sulfatase-like hydrolase/transferase [Gammaproteobacteria bacterium]|jgi:phosphoglycerol transferase MdoB-like AlkP superfamily enzyme|nr:sulfatase-like hydrolase/transferase [Gammaproteobacteria bacterium]MBT4451435.1 sulfatase-like hydrolase/transferase [Gammaproteobacteria bacterium]MBT7044156.1 sulfatase-like hydrolase/transferase [Gammaproteobacteria bacterium]